MLKCLRFATIAVLRSTTVILSSTPSTAFFVFTQLLLCQSAIMHIDTNSDCIATKPKTHLRFGKSSGFRNGFGSQSPIVRFGARCELDRSALLQREQRSQCNVLAGRFVLRSATSRAQFAKNGQNSRICTEIKARFLCSLDCLAEREGFESSVQVLPVQRFSKASGLVLATCIQALEML